MPKAKSGSEMVEVRNPNVPDYRGRVNAHKYAAMRKALLEALPRRGPGLRQDEMFEAVGRLVSRELFPGSTHQWWTKTVQLDLEARGVIVRDKDQKPLRWRRAPP